MSENDFTAVRIKKTVRLMLLEMARKNKRSMASQAEYLIEQAYFSQPEQECNPCKEKPHATA